MRNPTDEETPSPTPTPNPTGASLPPGWAFVGYAPNGNIVYADDHGQRMTFSSPDGKWNPYDGEISQTQNPPPPLSTPPPVTTAPPPAGGGGGAPPPGSLGSSLIDPFPDVFTPPTPVGIPGAPEFHPPEYKPPPAFEFDAFKAPTYEDAQNEPGYAFARDEGSRAIEHSNAAKGIYNTPGTLKELARFNVGLADQTYGNVFNRATQTYGTNYGTALGKYNTNYQTQFLDPYKFAYQSALDVFNPQFSAWQTNAQATQRGNEFNYNTAWDAYKFSYQKWLDRINTSTGLASL